MENSPKGSQTEINIMIEKSIKMMECFEGINSKYKTRQGIRKIYVEGKLVYTSNG